MSGYRVFAGVRREQDGAQLHAAAGESCIPILLDVTDEDSIRRAQQQVQDRAGPKGIRALVNNAGITIPGPSEILPMSDVRRQLDVNVTGTIAVTQAFLPLVRIQRGRIVMIGSIQGVLACPFFGIYAATKAALEGFSDTLRVELSHWGIDVVLVTPGRVLTPIWGKVLGGADRLRVESNAAGSNLYAGHMEAFCARARATSNFGISAAAVARVVEKALTARRPKTRYRIGGDAWRSALVARLLPDRWRDAILVRKYGLPPVESKHADVGAASLGAKRRS
jgi:NAD(P)-dependent dehydrogenase (short-subunit alcohol dehydrogenase family)